MMNVKLMFGTAALCVLSITNGHALRAQAAAEMRTWTEPIQPVHIVGPIHFVGTRGLGVYLIATPAGHILLDGGMPRSEMLIESAIRKLGYKPEDIRLLLITHAHADHVGTLAYFKKLSGAPIAAMAPDVPLLASGGKTDYVYARKPAFHFDPVVVDRVLKDGDTVAMGNVRMIARHTPGHTRGTTTWVTTVDDGKRSYRVVFPGSTTVNPGTQLVRRPPYPEIADDYRRSFAVLSSVSPDIFLGAHTNSFDFDQKRSRIAKEGVRAFVDPDGYRRHLAADKAVFDSLVTHPQ